LNNSFVEHVFALAVAGQLDVTDPLTK